MSFWEEKGAEAAMSVWESGKEIIVFTRSIWYVHQKGSSR